LRIITLNFKLINFTKNGIVTEEEFLEMLPEISKKHGKCGLAFRKPFGLDQFPTSG
jgi:hypothetical protein